METLKLGQFDKEAIPARDYCIAKNATLRIAQILRCAKEACSG